MSLNPTKVGALWKTKQTDSNQGLKKIVGVTTLQLFHKAHEDIPDVLSDMGDAGGGQVTPLTRAPAASVQWEAALNSFKSSHLNIRCWLHEICENHTILNQIDFEAVSHPNCSVSQHNY